MAQARPKSSSGDSAKESAASAVDVLKRENELLVETISQSTAAVKELEGKLAAENVALPNDSSVATEAAAPAKMEAEDYWTPIVNVPEGVEYKDEYGAISPVPGHDGTECFKWDNTLWSKADHFRYRWNVFKGFRSAIEQNEGGLDKFSQARAAFKCSPHSLVFMRCRAPRRLACREGRYGPSCTSCPLSPVTKSRFTDLPPLRPLRHPQGYLKYGLNRGEHEGKTGIWYREWAPAARSLALIGEFNNWTPAPEHWAVKNPFGVFELFLADKPDGTSAIAHR